MRIAFVLAQLGAGGTEEQARLLIRGCVERGAEVDVFTLGRSATEAAADFGGAPVRHLDRPREQRAAIGAARSAWRLRHALRSGKYDVAHGILARAHVLVPAVRPAGTKVVGWRRNLGDHLAGSSLRVAVERAAARRTDALVANSEPVARYWERTLRLAAGTVAVIPNALEDWRFERTEPAGAFPEPLVVSVGGLREVKGHRYLLEAVASLGARLRVAILGAGPLEMELREVAGRLGVPLELPGHVADPRPWLAAAAVYVHPSLSEGSSNAILEAMAYGCPIVATTVGDAAANLGDAGVLVPAADCPALAAAIDGVLAAPEATAEMARQARRRAEERHRASRMVDEHLDLYRRLTSRSK